MSFWGFIGILAILAVMAISLYVSKIAADRQQKDIEFKQKARNLHRKVLDIDEMINTLLIYDRDIGLLTVFKNEMLETTSEGLKLVSQSEILRSDMLNIRTIEQKIEALANNPKPPAIPGSDQQIHLMKKHFYLAVKLLKELQNTGKISSAQGRENTSRLNQNSLILEVKAYRNQGIKARDLGEISNAANFFKYAKELLVQSEQTFEDKTELIKQVSRDISGLYVTLPDESNDQ